MAALFQARPDLTGWYGMCSSTHWVASSTAQSVLERGGNAFDAAVSAAFVLHVVEPHLNGPGGDLVALIAPNGIEPQTLVGQGPAPAAASIEHFRSEGLDMVPGAGGLAAAVPGAVDAWLMLLRDHGTWPIDEVLAYGIEYARRGHPLLPKAADTIRSVAEVFLEHWPTSAAQWLMAGKAPRAGEIVRNVRYAATLERLLAHARGGSREARIDAARREWREGFVAHAIEDASRQPHWHSTGSAHRGVMTVADISAFEASYETPIRGRFRGYEVLKAGPWSQGPVLIQALAILDGFTDEDLDLSTARGVHIVLESLKLALADRDAYYSQDLDPAALARLVSPEYAAERRALIGERASRVLRPGDIGQRVPFDPPLVASGGPVIDGVAGEPTVRTGAVVRGDTCHIDVVDRWGNMISATPSGGWLQSSPFIPELGFALGTRLQMTWLDPNSPAALQPGRRPRTTLTPSLLAKDGEIVAAFGSPGGDQQDQWQALLLVQMLAGGHTPQQAIEAPAFHTTSFPNSFWPRQWTPAGAVVEDRLGDAVIEELTRRGHAITRAGDWAVGRLTAVTRDPETGLLGAAANPRGAQGYAVGR